MNLNEILKNVRNSDFERLGEINDVEVHGLSYDSRLINSGDLFFCFKGEKKDSHDFVYDAIKGGASALVVERKIDIDFPQVISSSSRKMMSEIAEIFYKKSFLSISEVLKFSWYNFSLSFFEDSLSSKCTYFGLKTLHWFKIFSQLDFALNKEIVNISELFFTTLNVEEPIDPVEPRIAKFFIISHP